MGIIQISTGPLSVGLEHNDVAIEQVDDGFGDLIDVFRIERVVYTNLTEAPWRLSASDGTTSWETTIAANEAGQTNIPPPQRYKSFPLTFRWTLIRN